MSLTEFTPKYLHLDQADDAAVVVRISVQLLTEDVNLEQFGHELFALVEQFGCRRLVVDRHELVRQGDIAQVHHREEVGIVADFAVGDLSDLTHALFSKPRYSISSRWYSNLSGHHTRDSRGAL